MTSAPALCDLADSWPVIHGMYLGDNFSYAWIQMYLGSKPPLCEPFLKVSHALLGCILRHHENITIVVTISMAWCDVVTISMASWKHCHCSNDLYGVMWCSNDLYGVMWCSNDLYGVMWCSNDLYGVMWCPQFKNSFANMWL
jgi:hypothetical protein